MYRSNPKPASQYAQMFSKFERLYDAFWESDERKKLEGVHPFPPTHDYIIGDKPCDFVIKELGKIIRVLKRNDRIESALKSERCYICAQTYEDCIEYEQVLKYTTPEIERLKAYCLKIVNEYYTKNTVEAYEIEAFEKEGRVISYFDKEEELTHLMDVLQNNSKLYKKVIDISWAKKTFHYAFSECGDLFLEIKESLGDDFNIDEYMDYYEMRKPETVIMKFQDGKSWWRLTGNNHPFESYIGSRPFGSGSHCGADYEATHFFSLRSETDGPNGKIYKSHATISVKAKTKRGYVVMQVKGPNNNPPSPKIWGHIIKLFLEKDMLYQETGSYGSDNDFHPIWLSGKHHDEGDDVYKYHDFKVTREDKKYFNELYEKFINKKPWWNSLLRAKLKFHPEEVEKEFSAKNWKAEKRELTDDGLVYHYNSFYELLDGISKHWGNQAGLIERFDEYIMSHEHHSSHDVDYNNFLTILEHQEPKYFEYILKCQEETGKELGQFDHSYSTECESDMLTMQDLMWQAEAVGWETATSDAKIDAYASHLDGKEITQEDSYTGVEYITARFDKEYDGSWKLTLFDNFFFWHGFRNEAVYNDSKIFNENDIFWDWEYEQDYAVEYFLENLPNWEDR
jgi:hypothetical protein